MTSKAARHIELCENSIRKWVQDKTIAVRHIAGRMNPVDIFTKEMRDGTHFQRLHNSFTSHLSDFLRTSLLMVHHDQKQSPHPILLAAARVVLDAGPSSYFSALAASSFCQTFTASSHLSIAGRQLLRGLHRLAPSHLL
jgi:hypothetical protein